MTAKKQASAELGKPKSIERCSGELRWRIFPYGTPVNPHFEQLWIIEDVAGNIEEEWREVPVYQG